MENSHRMFYQQIVASLSAEVYSRRMEESIKEGNPDFINIIDIDDTSSEISHLAMAILKASNEVWDELVKG